MDPSVDLVDELSRTPKLRVGRPRPVSVAGLSGLALDARAEPNTSQVGDVEIASGGIPIPAEDRLVPGFWFSESPEARFRFLVLEAEGATLFVYIEAARQGFEAFVRSTQRLLDTLRLA